MPKSVLYVAPHVVSFLCRHRIFFWTKVIQRWSPGSWLDFFEVIEQPAAGFGTKNKVTSNSVSFKPSKNETFLFSPPLCYIFSPLCVNSVTSWCFCGSAFTDKVKCTTSIHLPSSLSKVMASLQFIESVRVPLHFFVRTSESYSLLTSVHRLTIMLQVHRIKLVSVYSILQI